MGGLHSTSCVDNGLRLEVVLVVMVDDEETQRDFKLTRASDVRDCVLPLDTNLSSFFLDPTLHSDKLEQRCSSEVELYSVAMLHYAKRRLTFNILIIRKRQRSSQYIRPSFLYYFRWGSVRSRLHS